MLTRREYLALTAQAGAALALPASVFAQGGVITRPIPKTGEQLPIVGLGSSATFSQIAGAADVEAIRSVFSAMLDNGGTVFDTAPGYGASEEVAARAVNEAGLRDRVFWATKLNVAGRGSSADPARAREQVETSFKRLGRDKVDLIQVHNVADLATQLPILEEFKQAGRVRYIGTTTTFKPQYTALEQLMRDEPFDFIGIDYAVDNLGAEERIFPLAQERGIAVLGTMVVGSLPSHFSTACSCTRSAFMRSASARALMAAPSASPRSRIAFASPSARVRAICASTSVVRRFCSRRWISTCASMRCSTLCS